MHRDVPLVIAPMIEGLAFTEASCSQAGIHDEDDAIAYNKSVGATCSSRIEALLSGISPPDAPTGAFVLGYTLTVPLLDLFAPTPAGWVIDATAVSLICRTVAEVARPVVIYLQSNHFTKPDGALVAHLAADAANFMETSRGVAQPHAYFSVQVLPWTICDLDAPINRLRQSAVRAICTAIAALPAAARDRVFAVSLLGETHHLFADFDHGVSFLRPPDYTDYAAVSQAQFRVWLADRFGTIAALNDHLGARFASFADVDPPRPAPEDGGAAAPAAAPWRDRLAHLDHNAAGVIAIHGWADLAAGQSVGLLVDGVAAGGAITGLNRADILDPASGRPTDWGWAIDWDYRAMPAGPHRLTLAVMAEGRPIALIGERIVTIAGDAAGDAVDAAPATAPPLPAAVRGYVDHPAGDVSVRCNPLAVLWHRFRRWQVKRFIAHFADIAATAGLARERIFCHQLPVEMYGNWSSMATAERDSLARNDAYEAGITLYGAIARGTTVVAVAARHGWQRFGVGEHHPTMPLPVDDYRALFGRLREAGAVYVAPYFMSVMPERFRTPGEHRRYEIRPDNDRCGSADYHAALCALFTGPR